MLTTGVDLVRYFERISTTYISMSKPTAGTNTFLTNNLKKLDVHPQMPQRKLLPNAMVCNIIQIFLIVSSVIDISKLRMILIIVWQGWCAGCWTKHLKL